MRTCFGIGAKYASAIVAWNNAQYKHATSSTASIPGGAPIFFSGSKYGHVAVYAGAGLMRTTNSATNKIHTHTVASWVKAGYKLLGWTEDINGVRIPGLAPAPAAKTTAQLAAEVIAGKHGTGDARRRSLGPRYAEVQAEVNRILAGKTTTTPATSKTVAQMATEVIAGKHGTGHPARQKSLGISAAQYAQVRAEVNRRLS